MPCRLNGSIQNSTKKTCVKIPSPDVSEDGPFRLAREFFCSCEVEMKFTYVSNQELGVNYYKLKRFFTNNIHEKISSF